MTFNLLDHDEGIVVVDNDLIIQQFLVELGISLPAVEGNDNNTASIVTNSLKWTVLVMRFYGRSDGDNGYTLFAFNKTKMPREDISNLIELALTHDLRGELTSMPVNDNSLN